MSKDTNNTLEENELDKKLREIIWYELGDGLNATDVNECVESIKRLYASEVTPKVDALVQDMTNLHANMKNDMIRLCLTPTLTVGQIQALVKECLMPEPHPDWSWDDYHKAVTINLKKAGLL